MDIQEADIVVAEGAEPEAETTEEPAPEPTELELLQQKYDELNDLHLRMMAEYDNFRKRTQREKDELYGNAAANTVEKFLPVFDNLQRAAVFDPNSEDFAKGFELIRTGLSELLKNIGVEEFGEVGDAFDPNLHHAVSHIEDEAYGENVISQVMQKGYKMGERILRFALVQTAN